MLYQPFKIQQVEHGVWKDAKNLRNYLPDMIFLLLKIIHTEN